MRLAERGFRLDELHTGSAASQGHSLDKQLVHRSYGVLLMYFLWKIQQLRSQLRANDKNFSTDDLERTRASRDRFAAILRDAMSVRSGTDTVRFAALCTLLDLYVAFGTLRNAGPDDRPISDVTGLSDETRRLLASLVQEIDESTAHAVARIHDAYERRYARKAKKQLEPAPPSAAASLQQGRRRQQDDDDLDPAAPVRDDSDDDDEDANVGAASDAGSADGSESDDGNATTRTPTGAAAFAARLRAELAAEQQLCELTAKIVLALIGRVVDTDEGSVAQPETTGATVTNDAAGMLREKITRNRTRLGASYKEVVSYLDPAKAAGATQARKTKAVLEEAEEQSDIAHNGELRHDPIEEEPEQPHLELDVDVGVEQDDAVLHGQVDVDSIMDDDADEIDAADGAQANADEIEV
ncbi:hypothetical protein KEM52_005389 [Ascosphaera acerosa]|nr:hypothetical protein KEM52_005389 [Ascosphaera acerosa]